MLFSKVNSLSTFILLIVGSSPITKLLFSIKTEFFESFKFEVIPQVIMSSVLLLYSFLDKTSTGLCFMALKSEKGTIDNSDD